MNSEGWIKYIGDRNVHDADKYINNIINRKGFCYNVFELKETKKATGVVTFLNRKGEEYPDIGFTILPESEKKGYTLEAGKAYLEELTNSANYPNVIAITKPDNHQSISLLKKLGSQYEKR